MTITLEPETEARIRDIAWREGQGVETMTNLLLMEAFAQLERENAGDIAPIHEAMEDVEAGLERPYEEYMAERRQRYPDVAPA